MTMRMAAALMVLIAGPALAQEYERTPLPDLGGGLTNPASINSAGTVVGFSLNQTLGTRAVRFLNGNLEELSIPGVFSVAADINDAGKIVGHTVIGKQTLGFVWVSGSVSFLPGINGGDSRAVAINSNDVVVGSATDGLGHYQPVRWRFISGNWQVERLDPVQGREGEAVAVNDSGTIVGAFKNAVNEDRPFQWTESDGLEELPTLGGNRGLANDINSAGVIVGAARAGNGQMLPCVWTNGNAAALSTFGGVNGEAFAINDEGTIIGSAAAISGISYPAIWVNGVIDSIDSISNQGGAALDLIDEGTIIGSTPGVDSSGVLWTRTGIVYEAVDLGTLGGSTSDAFGVNDLGEVVGIAGAPNFESRGFLWRDGTMHPIPTFGGSTSAAFGINNQSQVVGYATLDNNQRRAFLYDDGVMTNLGTLGGNASTALAINEAGVVVGHSLDGAGVQNAFVWQSGVMTALPGLGGSTAEATAINESNLIVGFASSAAGSTLAVYWTFDGSEWTIHPVSDITSSFYKAFGVGDDGTIIGQFLNTGSAQVRAFSWFDEESTDLGLLAGNFSTAKAMNSTLIVGSGSGFTSLPQAIAFQDGDILNLNDRLRYSDDWVLNDARAINSEGWVAGSGRHQGVNRAFLLRPVPSSTTPATPTMISTFFGTHLAGGLNEILESDDQVYRARSRFGFTALEPNVVEVRIEFDANVPSANTLNLAIEARINHPSGTAKLRLRNWSNNSLQLIGEYGLTNTDAVETIEGIPAANFIRAGDERIELGMRHIVVAVFTALGFESRIDHITLESN